MIVHNTINNLFESKRLRKYALPVLESVAIVCFLGAVTMTANAYSSIYKENKDYLSRLISTYSHNDDLQMEEALTLAKELGIPINKITEAKNLKFTSGIFGIDLETENETFHIGHSHVKKVLYEHQK